MTISQKPFYRRNIGVVGGGQLGKMLAMAAAPLSLPITVMDKEPESSARGYTHHHIQGDPLNYDDIMTMAQNMDVVTIEMENVNVEALRDLEKSGKEVHPKPASLAIIQDKGHQKQFYADHKLPTSSFEAFESASALKKAVSDGKWQPPFVAKTCRAGYDGKGVFMINSHDDLEQLDDANGAHLIETKVPLKKELSVIVARNGKGETMAYPVNELHTHSEANLLSHMTCPAVLSEALEQEAKSLAIRVIEAFDIQGILAVELFVDHDDVLWVNEVSPRPHNTGHHTIEAFSTSQYEQHLRGILNLPLGEVEMHKASALLNVLGPVGQKGLPVYEGLDAILGFDGVKPHIYGKAVTKPHRKLGHITILADDLTALDAMIDKVNDTFVVRT